MQSDQPVTEHKHSNRSTDNQFAQEVLDGIADAVFIKDRDGKFLYCNSAGARFAQRPTEQIMGQCFEAVFDCDAAKQLSEQDQRVMSTGVTESIEHLIVDADGSRYYEVTKSPYLDAEGNTIGVLGSARDVTARRSAEIALQHQNVILEMIALRAPLHKTLELIVRTIDSEIKGAKSCILLTKADGREFTVAARGQLPESYCAAFEGLRISAETTPLGAALCRSTHKIVENISNLNRWSTFREIASTLGIQACFAFPIQSVAKRRNIASGTLVLLFHEPTQLTNEITNLIERMEYLSRIAIENDLTLQEIATSEARFRHFVDNTTDAFFMFDDTARVLDVSDRACEYLGYSRQELIGCDPRKFSPNMDLARFRSVIEKLVPGEHLSFETVHVRKDGSKVPVDIRLVHFEFENNEFVIGTIRDITHEKKAEESIRAKNQQLTSIYHTVSDIIFLIAVVGDGTYRIESANPACYTATGWRPEDIVGRKIDQVLSHNKLSKLTLKFQSAIDTKQVVRWEETLDFPAGTATGVVSISPVYDEEGGCTHLVGSVHDITERKQAEAILRRNKQRLADAQRIAKMGSWSWEPSTGEVWWSESLCELLGVEYTTTKPSFDAFLEKVHPDDRAYAIDRVEKMIAGEDCFAGDMRVCRPNGKYIWIYSCGRALRNPMGQIISVEGTDQDITERKMAEVAIEESRRLSKAIFQASPECIKVLDRDGRLQEMNSTGLAMLSAKSPGEVMGKSIFDVIAERDRDQFVEFHNRVIGGESLSLEFEIVGLDGSRRTVESSAVPADINGERMHLAVTRDVTERKRANEALRLARFTIENIHVGVIWTRQDRSIADANPEACSLLGYSHEQLLQLTMEEIDSEFKWNKWNSDWTCNCNRPHASFTSKYKRNDGTIFPVEIASRVLRFDGEELLCVFVQDISDRILAQNALRESEERYRLATLATNDLIWDYDIASGEIHWSDSYARVFERPFDTAQSIDWWVDHIYGPDRERVAHSLRDAIESRENHWLAQYKFLRADGVWADFSDRAYISRAPNGQARRVVGAMQDTTSRTQAERRVATQHAVVSILATSQDMHEAAPKLLRAVCETAGWSVGELWLVDKSENLLKCSEFWEIDQGNLEEFRQSAMRLQFARGEGLPGRVWETMQQEWITSLENAPGFRRLEAARKSKLISAFGLPISFGNEILGVATFFSHNSLEPDAELLKIFESLGIQIGQFMERKQAEGRLRLFRTLVDRASDFIEVIDPENGQILDVNQRACEAHGYTYDEYKRLKVADLDCDIIHRYSWQELSDACHASSSVSFVSKHRRKDGSEFPVEINANVIQLDRKFLVAIVRDVTERTQLEQHLRESQKMEAIGRLAGGVAHDFNNLLTVINGHTELLLTETNGESDHNDQLLAIQHAGQRAASLTAQLLAFSRKAFVMPAIVDLNEIVETAMRMLSRLIREDIELQFLPAPKLAPIKADAGQIEQVIINLVVNARDSMPNGGLVRIVTSNITICEDNQAEFPNLSSGEFVAIQVIDNGEGIGESDKDKIFEPFFTTKTIGKGTGLGLAVVHGVLQACGGHIRVESEIGLGTTFHLLFPAVEKCQLDVTEKANPSESNTANHATRGSETILLVEDESAVRNFARDVLKSSGYSVLVADSGATALQILNGYTHTIHLVITDVIMPSMGGRELVDSIRAIRPDLPTMFMSGHPDDLMLEIGLDSSGHCFLQKPFTPVELIEKIRATLDATVC